MIYDTIAVCTVVYFAAFVPVLAAGTALLPGNPLFRLYVLLVVVAYFGVCWRRGRTLGMQAWKLEIVDLAGRRPGWGAILRRLLAAVVSLGLGGCGYWLAWLDAERRTWPDRWSGTRLVPQGFTLRAGS